jgi:hypothetical protein
MVADACGVPKAVGNMNSRGRHSPFTVGRASSDPDATRMRHNVPQHECASSPIMRHALAAIEAAIFLGRPIALPAPRLQIRLSPSRQEHAPCGFEGRARLVERRRGAALMFAGMGSRIKPAAPAPRIGVGWIARAERDRADAHIAVVDLPGLLRGVRVAAASEGGHVP